MRSLQVALRTQARVAGSAALPGREGRRGGGRLDLDRDLLRPTDAPGLGLVGDRVELELLEWDATLALQAVAHLATRGEARVGTIDPLAARRAPAGQFGAAQGIGRLRMAQLHLLGHHLRLAGSHLYRDHLVALRHHHPDAQHGQQRLARITYQVGSRHIDIRHAVGTEKYLGTRKTVDERLYAPPVPRLLCGLHPRRPLGGCAAPGSTPCRLRLAAGRCGNCLRRQQQHCNRSNA